MNAKLTQDELQAIKESVEEALHGDKQFDFTYVAGVCKDIPKLIAEIERLQRLLERATPALFGFWAEEQQKNADLSAEIERLQAEVHEHSAHNGHLIATHVIPTKEESKRLRADNERLQQRVFTARKMAEVGAKYGNDIRYAEILDVLNGGIDI